MLYGRTLAESNIAPILSRLQWSAATLGVALRSAVPALILVLARFPRPLLFSGVTVTRGSRSLVPCARAAWWFLSALLRFPLPARWCSALVVRRCAPPLLFLAE